MGDVRFKKVHASDVDAEAFSGPDGSQGPITTKHLRNHRVDEEGQYLQKDSSIMTQAITATPLETLHIEDTTNATDCRFTISSVE
jgi:hypothetical protein